MIRVGHVERGRRMVESGNKLEKWFEGFLHRIGFKKYNGSYEEFFQESPRLKGLWYIRRVNVGLSEYGFYANDRQEHEGFQYADFILFGLRGYKRTGLRVECKRQDTEGSADEKLCYTVANIQRARIPGWIGWVGDGWKNGAINRAEAYVKRTKYLDGVYEMEVVKKKLRKLI